MIQEFDALTGLLKWATQTGMFPAGIFQMFAPQGAGLLLVESNCILLAFNSITGDNMREFSQACSFGFLEVFNRVVSAQFTL